MSPRPAVSVALCTHNGARFVVEQVRSILDQTEPPAQVVLSDDASSDETVALVEELWAGLEVTAPELVVLRNPTALGVTRNFEQAALACACQLIAFSDQDDVWAPNRLQRMVDAFEASPSLGLLFTDARLVDAVGESLEHSLFEALEVGGRELAEIRDGDAFGVLLRRNLVTGATMMLRRELVEIAAPFPESWIHDEWLAIIASAVGKVDWLPDRLVDYRQHGGNQIGVTSPTLRYKVSRVFESRGDRYLRLAERALVLLERLDTLNVPVGVIVQARNKLRHQQTRASLPALRIARLPVVLREAVTGNYARFSSQGNLDIFRDLLSPVRG